MFISKVSDTMLSHTVCAALLKIALLGNATHCPNPSFTAKQFTLIPLRGREEDRDITDQRQRPSGWGLPVDCTNTASCSAPHHCLAHRKT